MVTITPFETEDDAVRFANSSKYGLAASVWTADGKRATRVAHRLHAGQVWVNCWMFRDLRVPFVRPAPLAFCSLLMCSPDDHTVC